MKNYKNFLKFFFIVLVFGGMLVTSVFFIVAKRPTTSESEKRELASKPKMSFTSLLSGKYFTDLQYYYNDTIPNREAFKTTGASVISKLKGVSIDGIVIYNPVLVKATEEPDDEDETFVPRARTTPVPPEGSGDAPATSTPLPTDEPETEPPVITDEPVNTEVNDNTAVPDTSEPVGTPVPTATATTRPTATPTATPARTPDSGGEPAIVEYPKDGAILYGDMGMELYGGSKNAMKRYVAALEYIKDRCPDLNVYSMTVPLSSMFYLPASYKSNATEQLNDLNYLEGLFSSKVTVVNVYNTMKSHVDEKIYLRTDHHWTYLGAYYCMREFAAKAGVPFIDLSEYTVKSKEGYVGSFYSYFGMKALIDKPETFTYYISPNKNVRVKYYDASNFSLRSDIKGSDNTNAYFENLKVSYSYSIAMYMDDVISIADTGAGTGRRLLIIKDSFGNPTPSFLFGSFDRIVMIDPRYYTMDVYDLIRSQGITDVLGLANIFDHTTTGFVKLYEYVAQNRE